jgi:hypothetical protein
MHPMFVELFIKTDADDLLSAKDRQHRSRRSRRAADGDHQACRPCPATAVIPDPPAVAAPPLFRCAAANAIGAVGGCTAIASSQSLLFWVDRLPSRALHRGVWTRCHMGPSPTSPAL